MPLIDLSALLDLVVIVDNEPQPTIREMIEYWYLMEVRRGIYQALAEKDAELYIQALQAAVTKQGDRK